MHNVGRSKGKDAYDPDGCGIIHPMKIGKVGMDI
jgi:hypothetical protein